MNENHVIKLENIRVEFRLLNERINSFKEYAIRGLQSRITYNKFIALNDISVQINRGENLGVIGNNGAGKSTLMKVIARVHKPTSGRVIVKGKVTPLLEVGAGFHPELTGIENIYLNGAILGYSRSEIEGKIDSIINFSELGGFITSPVRTYSTGMYARLGFSIATAWQTSILIIDEVLSVGDESFQKKCKDRIQEFQLNDTTILLVSHDLNTIKSMCDRVLWIEKGILKAIGSPEKVIEAYRYANQ